MKKSRATNKSLIDLIYIRCGKKLQSDNTKDWKLIRDKQGSLA